ncbi:hypothetical protein E2562_017780, partial [Oryza meyeriana var. granulata]
MGPLAIERIHTSVAEEGDTGGGPHDGEVAGSPQALRRDPGRKVPGTGEDPGVVGFPDEITRGE